MLKLAMVLPVAALLATTGAAAAAEVDMAEITQMNARTGQILLNDGHSYTIANPVLLNGVIPGEQVIVTVNDDHTIGFSEDTSYFDKSSGAPTN